MVIYHNINNLTFCDKFHFWWCKWIVWRNYDINSENSSTVRRIIWTFQNLFRCKRKIGMYPDIAVLLYYTDSTSRTPVSCRRLLGLYSTSTPDLEESLLHSYCERIHITKTKFNYPWLSCLPVILCLFDLL